MGKPIIAHVEVGGTLGGSAVCADLYLRFCGDQFSHELLFYSQPTERELPCRQRFPIRDLGFRSAMRSSSPVSATGVRRLLKRIPVLRSLAIAALRLRRALHIVPTAIALSRIFRLRNYALIHCNNNFNYQPATILAARLARKPLVSHYRTPGHLSWLDKWLSRYAGTIVAINDSVARSLITQGVDSRVTVCQDPCERPKPPASDIGRLLRGATAKWLVGTLSRLEENKGVDVFLAALAILLPQRPGVRAVIVGDGSQLTSLRTWATLHGIAEAVTFTGFVDNAYQYLSTFDVFVCPSRNEGGPLTVLEAMLLGVPVVTTRVGAVDSWIREPAEGLIVPVGDPVKLADAIGTLLDNEPLRGEISQRGRIRAAQYGDPGASAAALDSLFSAVLSKGKVENGSD